MMGKSTNLCRILSQQDNFSRNNFGQKCFDWKCFGWNDVANMWYQSGTIVLAEIVSAKTVLAQIIETFFYKKWTQNQFFSLIEFWWMKNINVLFRLKVFQLKCFRSKKVFSKQFMWHPKWQPNHHFLCNSKKIQFYYIFLKTIFFNKILKIPFCRAQSQEFGHRIFLMFWLI